jgi:integrase
MRAYYTAAEPHRPPTLSSDVGVTWRAPVPNRRSARQTQDADRQVWENQWRGGQWIFTREGGAPLLPQFVTKRFEQLVRKTNLQALTFHGLRHQHASLLIAQGVELAVVSKRLGHSSIAITSDLCSHLLRDANRHAGEAAEALVPRAEPAAGGDTVHTLHTRPATKAPLDEAPVEELLL